MPKFWCSRWTCQHWKTLNECKKEIGLEWDGKEYPKCESYKCNIVERRFGDIVR